MKYLLVTNNRRVQEEFRDLIEIMFIDSLVLGDVLILARNLIHKGARLLTHPMSGSIKPNETPFKSILMKDEDGVLDLKSLEILESSIQTYNKFLKMNKVPEWPENLIEDFRLIDYELIRHVLENNILLRRRKL